MMPADFRESVREAVSASFASLRTRSRHWGARIFHSPGTQLAVFMFTLIGVLMMAADVRGEPRGERIERKLAGCIEGVAVSPDGRWVAASDRLGALVLFSTDTSERKLLVPHRSDPVADAAATWFHDLSFTDDATVLVGVPNRAVDGSQSIHCFSVRNAKRLLVIDASEKRDIQTGERIAGDPLLQVISGLDGTRGTRVRLIRLQNVETWDVASGKKLESTANNPLTQQMSTSNNETLTASRRFEQITISDATSGRSRFQFDGGLVSARREMVEANRVSCRLLGFSSDASILLLWVFVWDENLGRGNLDSSRVPTGRGFIEAYSTLDAKLTWRRECSNSTFPWTICSGVNVLAVADAEGIVFLAENSGDVQGRMALGAKCQCIASRDGVTYWAGTSHGDVLEVRYPSGGEKK
jgi:hypothetical protein